MGLATGTDMNPSPIATSESAVSWQGIGRRKKRDPFKIPPVPCEIAFEFQGVETIWDGYFSRYEGHGSGPCDAHVSVPRDCRGAGEDSRQSERTDNPPFHHQRFSVACM